MSRRASFGRTGLESGKYESFLSGDTTIVTAYTFVKLNTVGKVVLSTANTDLVIGVALNAPAAANVSVLVQRLGRVTMPITVNDSTGGSGVGADTAGGAGSMHTVPAGVALASVVHGAGKTVAVLLFANAQI